MSYPVSRNPFSLFTASLGLAVAAGPGWQISIGGAAERRRANVDRVGLVDRELRREGDLASSIGLLDMRDGFDPVNETVSWSILLRYLFCGCAPFWSAGSCSVLHHLRFRICVEISSESGDEANGGMDRRSEAAVAEDISDGSLAIQFWMWAS